ncbi:RNA 2'-phosphotransferase [Dyella sp. 7MK23]|uniref:Probable RNA 2'-phosphotransferase n=1 Tax=Dyella acidiphila TaxID=2775866 RepID=A0ABR9G781_9GAMM|nr:RNA 2'-phosphotransferase [Dyella acidiphila]
MDKTLVSKSKFLSLVLRHQPESIGLMLDPNGWADVQELVRLANAHGNRITFDDIRIIVSLSEKQRFALDPSGLRIRANQGHSVKVDLELSPLQPPEILYHGTATRFLPSIHQSGLLKGARHHVHLSRDADTANAVGRRHGQPVILTILAEDMWRSGQMFYQSDNGVWLTDHVPVSWIKFPA